MGRRPGMDHATCRCTVRLLVSKIDFRLVRVASFLLTDEDFGVLQVVFLLAGMQGGDGTEEREGGAVRWGQLLTP